MLPPPPSRPDHTHRCDHDDDGSGRDVLVIADDLTGATDTAGAFAVAGLRCIVELDNLAAGNDEAPAADVLVIDTNGRALSEADARTTTIRSVHRHHPSGLFIKIDSTLRGHVRATVESGLAALAHPPARVVICPAFPRNGRTVLEGRVHVHGVALEGPSLAQMFDGFADDSLVKIADAQTDDDLAALVATSPRDTLWVGSAGLAYHLARLMTARVQTPAAPNQRPAAQRVVVVAGSLHPRTAEQLARLGGDVTVIAKNPLDAQFQKLVTDAASKADGLVLTGGATARAVLELLGVRRLVVGGEVEAGVPWSLASATRGEITIVTKAGGFGDPQTLQRAVQFLVRS